MAEIFDEIGNKNGGEKNASIPIWYIQILYKHVMMKKIMFI